MPGRRLRRPSVGSKRLTWPQQATFSFLPFDIASTLARARKRVPEYKGPDPIIWFGRHKFLAFIQHRSDGFGVPSIFIHELLNSRNTPEAVLEHILVHELLHLVIPVESINGKLIQHTPRFWAAEAQASPYSIEFFEWCSFAASGAISVNRKDECICVKRGWHKILADQEMGLEHIGAKFKL